MFVIRYFGLIFQASHENVEETEVNKEETTEDKDETDQMEQDLRRCWSSRENGENGRRVLKTMTVI